MIDEKLYNWIFQNLPYPLAYEYDYYIKNLYEAMNKRGNSWEDAVIAQRELIDITLPLGIISLAMQRPLNHFLFAFKNNLTFQLR